LKIKQNLGKALDSAYLAYEDEIVFRLVDTGSMVPDDEYDTIYPSFKEWINSGAVLDII
jgi:hypothetical protein